MKDGRIKSNSWSFYAGPGMDDLSGLTPVDKSRWLRGRFEKVVVKPLRAIKRIGAKDEAVWDLNLGVVSIICSAIEALGSFYRPDLTDHESFREFVYDFMAPEYQQAVPGLTRTIGDVLYGDFRCGLSHGFTIEGHEIATRPSRYIKATSGYVSIDLWSLFDDLCRAFGRYITAVGTDPDTRARFLVRFDRLFVLPYSQKPLAPVIGTKDKRIHVHVRASR